MAHGNVWLLTATIAVIGANALVLSPIAATVAASFAGVTPTDVMTAAALYGFATALSALSLAPLVDRIGAEKALARALVALVVATATTAGAPRVEVLWGAQILAGLAAGTALPAIYTLAAQIAPPGRESATLSVVLIGWTLSLVAGVSVSAVIADWANWRVVFALLALLASTLTFAVVTSDDWGEAPAARRATSPTTALCLPGAAAQLATVAAYMAAFYGLYAYLGAHLYGLGVSTAIVGLAPLAYGLGFGAAAPLGRVIDRQGAVAMAPFVFAGLTIVYLALAAATAAAPALITLCIAWGIANHLGLNLIVARLTALDRGQRGAVMGLYSAVTYLAMAAGTLGFGVVFEHAGLAACALLSAACIAPALAAALFRATAKARGDEHRPAG